MEKISTAADLKAFILVLEVKQEEERLLMKKEFHQAYESMKPINLIKSTFKEVAQSQDIKNNLVNTGVGLAAGYVSKALFEGATHSPLRKLLGTALMFGITNVITKNPETVKKVTNGIVDFVKSKFVDNETETKETTPDNEHRN
jgi:hypothetical protein